MVLGQLPLRKIAPNPNPNSNPSRGWGAIAWNPKIYLDVVMKSKREIRKNNRIRTS